MSERIPNISEGRIYVVLPRNNPLAEPLRGFFERYGLVQLSLVEEGWLVEQLQNPRWYATALILFSASSATLAMVRAAAIQQRFGVVYLEGPLSSEVAATINVETVPLAELPGEAEVVSDQLAEHLDDVLGGYVSGRSIQLSNIAVTAYRIEVDEYGKKRKVAVPAAGAEYQPLSAVGLIGVAQPILHAGEVLLGEVSGGWLVSGFPLLTLIALRLQPPELEQPMYQVSGERNGENLELAWILSLAAVAARNGFRLVGIDPWPSGIDTVLTVRHDVDRPVAAEQWDRLLAYHQQARIPPSWYYLKSTVDQERIAQTVALGHEVALHYTNLASRGNVEDGAVRRAVQQAGGNLDGATCHGGNFHGLSDLEWLAERDFSYAEILTRCTFHPFRSGSRTADDRPLLVSARHLSVDRTMSPPTADFGYGYRTLPVRKRLGGSVVIMNHPDINFAELCDGIEAYRSADQACWTQSQVSAWWRASHDSTRPSVSVQPAEAADRDLVCSVLESTGAVPQTLQVRVWGSAEGADRKDQRFCTDHALIELSPGQPRPVQWSR